MNDLLLWPTLGGALALVTAAFLVLQLLKKSRGQATVVDLARTIRSGANLILRRQLAAVGLLALLLLAVGAALDLIWPGHFPSLWRMGVAFVTGVLCMGLACSAGLSASIRSNSRVAEAARQEGINGALEVAIGGGAVMGLSAIGFSLIGLTMVFYFLHERLSIITAYALGISAAALIFRLSGGLFAKGADIGADLVGRLEAGFPEDDVRNPATAADHVGDFLGDVIGLGADLMDSYVETILACMIVAMSIKYYSPAARAGTVMLPLIIATLGVCASIISILFIRNFVTNDPQKGLMAGTIMATGLTVIGSWFIVEHFVADPSGDLRRTIHTRLNVFLCLMVGFVSSAIVCFFAEFHTSLKYWPSRRVAERCQFGPSLGIVEGMRVGMSSSAVSVLVLVAGLTLSYHWAGLFGLTLSAFGMVAIAGMIITVNSYCPIADSADGIAEMAHMDRSVRDIVESLHSVGNTASAVGKGFASFSSALAALALLIAFLRVTEIKSAALSLSNPGVLAGLFLGGMFPYYYGSLLLRAVGVSASATMEEIRRQFREIPGIKEGKIKPDYRTCVAVIGRRALSGMLLPAFLAIALPIVVGLAIGREALAGLLVGALLSGLMLSLQMVHAGGAMDSAKHYIEEGFFDGKGSETHKAALLGDTVGDAFKDVVGPSMNILIKLLCVVALVIAPLL